MAHDSFLKTAAPLLVLTAIGAYNLLPMTPEEKAAAADVNATAQQVEASVHYRYCSDARAAGNAPLYRGAPGYAAHLDRDGDGIACEPHF